jgi:hypothetical protein
VDDKIKEQILKEIGLTDSELHDYLRKLSGFYNSFLTPAERKVFRAGLRAQKKEALKSFHSQITAAQLEEFIKSREPKDARVVMIVEGCGGGDGDDEIEK